MGDSCTRCLGFLLTSVYGHIPQVFNNTPDETAFFRLMLEREGVTGSLIMIQPTLFAYPLEGPPYPVLLDVASLKPDIVLLLDTWFLIVVQYGSTIAAWRKAGYQDQAEYASFRWIATHVLGQYVATIVYVSTARLCI